jgi:hypothetical protein
MANSEKKPSQDDDKSGPRNNGERKSINTGLSSFNSNAGEASLALRKLATSRAANAARERWSKAALPNADISSDPEPQATNSEQGGSSIHTPQESVVKNLSPLEEVEALQRELDQIQQIEPSRARSQMLRDLAARIRRMEALSQVANTRTGEVKTTERLVRREVQRMTNIVLRAIVESSRAADLSLTTVTNCECLNIPSILKCREIF